VGFLDTIETLELSDEVKEQLRREHSGELDPLKTERDGLRARSRKSAVEEEVKALGSVGFSQAPGLLKFYRRVLLSPDAEEPGAVLLSDTELELSGEQATGATGREEMSVAGVLRKFVELLPRNNEGRLELSDMALETEDHSRPADGGTEEGETTDDHRKNLEKVTGRQIKRTRKRYGAGIVSGGGGED
jgi:hypothetical protein